MSVKRCRPSLYTSALNMVGMLLLLFRSQQTHAGTIDFGAATTITGDTDVFTLGTLHTAYNGSNTVQTVNGVQFAGSNSTSAWGANLSWTMGAGSGSTGTAYATTSNPFNALSTPYKTILGGGIYNGGSAATGTINNLTIARVYAVQFWVSDSRSGSTATRTETIANVGGAGAQTLDYNSTNAAGGVGQYTIGYFTADAATQSFEFDGNASSQVNAIQVRDMTGVGAGFWTGTGGTNWDNSSTANFTSNAIGSALNIVTADTAQATTSGNLTFADVYYDDLTPTAATNTAVVVDAAGVSSTKVYFDNNTLNYTFTNASGTTGITGSTALYKRGGGTVTLASANTHTGGNFITGGTLIVASDAALGGTNNTTTISTGGTLRPGANFAIASGHTLSANGGTINGNGLGFTLSSANVLTGSGGLIIQGNSSTNSTLSISANQNISGAITISSGRINVSGSGLTSALGSGNVTVGTGTSSLYVSGSNNTFANNFSISTNGGENRGAIRLQGSSQTLSGSITTTGTATVSADGGTATTHTFNGQLIGAANTELRFGGATGANAATVYDINATNTNFLGVLAIGAGITDVASFSDYGTASAIGNRAQAAETATGNGIGIRIAGGTLRYSGSTNQFTNRELRLLNSTANAIESSGAGTLSFTHTGANTNLFDTAGTRTLTLKGSNTGNNTFSIKLENQGTNATSLIKDGVGKWILNATDSTYTGTTTINGGTLLVNGRHSGATLGAYAVNSGGKLGGSGDGINSGLIEAAIAINNGGAITAGDVGSVGKLTTGAQTWNTDGTYQVDFADLANPSYIDGAAQGNDAAGTNWDLLALSGWTGPSSGSFRVELTGSALVLPSGATQSYAWVIGRGSVANAFADISGLSLGTSGLTGFSGDTSNLSLGTLSGGQELAVIYSPVPEPSGLVLLVGMAASLLFRRRHA